VYLEGLAISVNISLRLSGILAFFAILVFVGTSAMVTMSTAGVLPIADAIRGLVLLYGCSIVCVGCIYVIELDQ